MWTTLPVEIVLPQCLQDRNGTTVFSEGAKAGEIMPAGVTSSMREPRIPVIRRALRWKLT
jgi:hypothetical protein